MTLSLLRRSLIAATAVCATIAAPAFAQTKVPLRISTPAVPDDWHGKMWTVFKESLDKSAPGVSLTQRGTTVMAQARRLLAINDEILQVTNGHTAIQTLRVGIPGDYSGSRIPATLARFRLRWPDIGFTVTSGSADTMLPIGKRPLRRNGTRSARIATAKPEAQPTM